MRRVEEDIFHAKIARFAQADVIAFRVAQGHVAQREPLYAAEVQQRARGARGIEHIATRVAGVVAVPDAALDANVRIAGVGEEVFAPAGKRAVRGFHGGALVRPEESAGGHAQRFADFIDSSGQI